MLSQEATDVLLSRSDRVLDYGRPPMPLVVRPLTQLTDEPASRGLAFDVDLDWLRRRDGRVGRASVIDSKHRTRHEAIVNAGTDTFVRQPLPTLCLGNTVSSSRAPERSAAHPLVEALV